MSYETIHQMKNILVKRLSLIGLRTPNNDSKLNNRNGAGVMPYELLKPYSKPGVTRKGVPCSISI
ncbi:hypothetical protein H5410_000171 [Solanum commersonii]|uniref:Lipoxygenase domain-containing protein n=1 Tax=Solanum commersonii TaxID=4109 RepID=A0A9J6AV92_SOLCO|nr:hypothetical protein H5410_000171 [Solanum commersonii]